MAAHGGLGAAMLTVVFAVGCAVVPLLGAGASAVMPFVATMILAAACIALVTAWVVRTLPREQRAEEALAARLYLTSLSIARVAVELVAVGFGPASYRMLVVATSRFVGVLGAQSRP